MAKKVDMGDDPDGDLEEMDRVSAYPIEIAGYGKTATAPYISTDRADLLRIVEHAKRVKATLDAIPAANVKVTAAQWSMLTHELHTLVTFVGKVERRIDDPVR